jgi:hypothetical protein
MHTVLAAWATVHEVWQDIALVGLVADRIVRWDRLRSLLRRIHALDGGDASLPKPRPLPPPRVPQGPPPSRPPYTAGWP